MFQLMFLGGLIVLLMGLLLGIVAAGRTTFVELLIFIFNLAVLGFAWGIYKLTGE